MQLPLLGPVRWAARVLSFNRCVRCVALALPRRQWYRAALRASRLHGRLSTLEGGNGALTEAIMLDHWLRQLTVSGHFPIPWVLRDRSGLDAGTPGRGTLFCCTHTPLVEIALRAFIQLGFAPPAVVADSGNMARTMHFRPPGVTQHLAAIPADTAGMLRMRTILRQGGGVVCLADDQIGGQLSPSAMKLAGRTGARVVFSWAERRPGGLIEIFIVPAPYPDCASQAEIEANLHWLQAHRQRLFAALGLAEPPIHIFAELAGLPHQEL